MAKKQSESQFTVGNGGELHQATNTDNKLTPTDEVERFMMRS